MVRSIEVFIGVEKKVTDRNLKGYRLFIHRMSAVTKKTQNEARRTINTRINSKKVRSISLSSHEAKKSALNSVR